MVKISRTWEKRIYAGIAAVGLTASAICANDSYMLYKEYDRETQQLYERFPILREYVKLERALGGRAISPEIIPQIKEYISLRENSAVIEGLAERNKIELKPKDVIFSALLGIIGLPTFLFGITALVASRKHEQESSNNPQGN